MSPMPSRCKAETLFVQRMRREGLYEEIRDRAQEYRIANNCTWRESIRGIMDDYGFVSLDQERRLARIYRQSVKDLEKKMLEANSPPSPLQRVEGARQQIFEDVLRELPDNANGNDEWDFIRSHPAMSRKARGSNTAADVLLTIDDITEPHKAPSKAAVHMLQHWVNNPAEFFKRDMDNQKAKLKEQAAKERQTVMDPQDLAYEQMGIKQAMSLLENVADVG